MALGLNSTRNSPSSFRSTTGPSTRKASSAPGVTWAAKPRARKASTLEQTETTTASSIRLSTEMVGAPPTASSQLRGSKVCTVAAMAQPSTSRAARSRNSRLPCWSTSCKGGRATLTGCTLAPMAPTSPLRRSSSPTWAKGWLSRRSSSSTGSSNSASGSRRSTVASSTASSRAAPGRAASSQGWLGKAAQVLASTIGFSTGAANKKPRAVPTGAPPASSRRATGTLPHSQAGRAKPRAAPVRGPSRGWAGSCRSQAPPGASQRARLAIPTPISRNGRASSSRP